MGEELTYTEQLSGVNSEPVAAEPEITSDPAATTEPSEPAAETIEQQTTGPTEEPGVETEEAAAPTQDEKVEKAFAKRLEAERQKLQQEIAQQAQTEIMQRVQQEMAPLLELAQSEAQKYGLDPITWAMRVKQSQPTPEQAQQQALTQYVQQVQAIADEQGIDANWLLQIVSANPELRELQNMRQQFSQVNQQLQQKQTFEQEGQELFAAYPDIDPKKIPPEVFKLREERGIPLKQAYEITTGLTEATQLRSRVSQLEQALAQQKKNEANATSSPGSVTGNGPVQADFISRDSFEQNKGNRRWVMDNLEKIQTSRAKW